MKARCKKCGRFIGNSNCSTCGRLADALRGKCICDRCLKREKEI